jgi:ethanolamine utilization microcompartment shell protein EutL
MGDAVLDDGVDRGAPLPEWVRMAPLPVPAGVTLRAGTALLHADTQLFAGKPSATFFHRAERVNDSAGCCTGWRSAATTARNTTTPPPWSCAACSARPGWSKA